MACEARIGLRTLRTARSVFRMTAPPQIASSQPATVGGGDQYLKVREVAAILRVSVRHVHNLAHAGELDYIMPGRVMRIPESSLRAYIKRAGSPQN